MVSQINFRHRGRFVVVLWVLLLASSAAFAGEKDALDPVLRIRAARQLDGRSRVIVEFNGAPDPRAISANGGTAGRALDGTAALVADIDNYALDALAADPRVARVRADHPAFATLERTGAAIGVAIARQQFDVTGNGIGIAIIDSGITSWHDDLYLQAGRGSRLGDRVVHFKDFTQGTFTRGRSSDAPSDEYGHGTHVAGIVAGSGHDSDGRRTGIAPGADLIGLKVLDASGFGYISDVIAAIDYAIAVRTRFNIRVINLSVATGVFESYRTDPLAQAARRAVAAGIIVVTSAGNLGLDAEGHPQAGGITSPGNAPWVITVGASSHNGSAVRHDDHLASFSSRGPTRVDRGAKPDLVAFGVGIESLSDPESTLYSTYANYLLDGTLDVGYHPYLSMSGTSMAAPVVTGTIALMLEANPSLTPNAVKAILEYTSQDRAEGALAEGAGLLNAQGALRMARFFDDPASAIGAPGDTIESEWIPWSRHLLWGNALIGGGVPLPGRNAWNRDVVWGAAATADGTPVVWGARADEDNIVWSTAGDDNIVWSTAIDDNIVWSTANDDNIVWSTASDDNIVWSTAGDDNIVWSTGRDDDNIVWSTSKDDDNIVWSTGAVVQILWPPDAVLNDRQRATAPRK
jgi:serine protease AprX